MRAYHKRAIYIKDTGSSLFKEAYFILNDVQQRADITEDDMISEANRIIEESVGNQKGKRGAIGLKETIFFISGFLISSIISLVIAYII